MTTRAAGSARRPRWYDGLEPVTASVRCRGELHSVSWRAGRLVLHDHDLAVEAALIGLGGEGCSCVDLVELCRHDVASLGPFPLWTADVDLGGGGGGAAVAPHHADRRLDLLRALPVPFRRRLALGGFVAVSRGSAPVEPWANPPFAWVFGRLLSDAAAATAQAARPDLDGSNPMDVRWVGIPSGRHPRVEGWLGPRVRSLRLELSPRWVADVWAHGLAVQGDALALAPTSGRRYLALRWSEPDDRGRSAAYLAVKGR